MSRKWDFKEKEPFHFQTMNLGQKWSTESYLGAQEDNWSCLMAGLYNGRRDLANLVLRTSSDFTLFSVIRISVEIWKTPWRDNLSPQWDLILILYSVSDGTFQQALWSCSCVGPFWLRYWTLKQACTCFSWLLHTGWPYFNTEEWAPETWIFCLCNIMCWIRLKSYNA